MTHAAPALMVNGLKFTYPAATAPTFSDLDLSIPAGAVTAILGPNGSGKTTLLYLFLGLLSPTAGAMRLLGKDRSAYSPKAVRQTIGLVPQNETVPFDLSLMEYVLLGRAPFLHLLQRPGEKDREIAEEALQTVGLEEMAHRKVTTLSSGEKQLAATARALCQEPDILLMDEPTSHLDLANARRILRLMTKIAQKGKSVVFTTHDPNAAAAAAHHVVLLAKNRLLASSPASRALTQSLLSDTYEERVEVVETERGPVVLTMET